MLDKLPNHPILEYRPDTLQYVRSLYNLESPGRMDESIDKLEDWVKKQPHFIRMEYPREYLERTIIATKGSVERAKIRIDKVCTFRTIGSHALTPSTRKIIWAKRILCFFVATNLITMLEKLPDHPILKYHPNTLNYVRSLYDLDSPGRMDEAIDLLEDWIQKQPYFVTREYPREYLERTIISSKGSIENAKTRIDKVCKFRTLMPHLIQEHDIRKLNQNDSLKFFYTAQPKLTEDHYRVIVIKAIASHDTKSLHEFYNGFLIFTEHMKAYDYSTGAIYVLDFTEIDIMAFISCMNPLELRDLVAVTMKGYGVRIKGIYFFTPSKAIDTVISIFKKVISEKIASRISLYKDVESLHKVLPKEYLPEDYGGEQKPMEKQREEWMNILSTEENILYQKDMSKACTVEAMRPKDEQSEPHLGVSGTFRALNVD